MPIKLILRLPLVFAIYLCAMLASAQDLSPRAFWPAPEGTQILTLGYSYTSGDTLTDPSLPITGINSDIHKAFAALFQTFNLAGRTANFILEAPYIWAESKGTIGEGFDIDREPDGMADVAATVSVNLMGAPSLDHAGLQALRADAHPLLGVSLRVVVPTGNYNRDELINTGANRWATKAELGYIYPLNPKWLMEFEVGAWVFGDNDEFLGTRKEQDPIYAAELHLVRRFRPGFWGSLDANYYRGGQTTVDGDELDDLQRTSKYGATLVFPFDRGKAIKIAYSGGSTSGKGNDFDTVLISFNALLP